MRPSPSRTMWASLVPLGSTRRRTVSMAASMAPVMRCLRPKSVGVMVKVVPSVFFTSTSALAVPISGLPICWGICWRALRAASVSSALAMRTSTELLEMPTALTGILASRRRERASPTSAPSQSLRTSLISML